MHKVRVMGEGSRCIYKTFIQFGYVILCVYFGCHGNTKTK